MKSKEEIKSEIFKTVEEFYRDHKLPPQNISSNEWNAFFEVIEAHFLAHNIMKNYEVALNLLVRRALYFSQVEGIHEFNINHLIHSLCDMTVFNINQDEIMVMGNEIEEKIQNHKHRK